jgi:hypothetical protein
MQTQTAYPQQPEIGLQVVRQHESYGAVAGILTPRRDLACEDISGRLGGRRSNAGDALFSGVGIAASTPTRHSDFRDRQRILSLTAKTLGCRCRC